MKLLVWTDYGNTHVYNAEADGFFEALKETLVSLCAGCYEEADMEELKACHNIYALIRWVDFYGQDWEAFDKFELTELKEL